MPEETRHEDDERPGLTPEEAKAEERTSANEELSEAFGDTGAHETRLEQVAAEEGDKVEEHEHDREASAEDKADDIANDGVIFHGGG
jgi:hypothetical protein